MKNIETILADAQIELTEEQKESINKELLENYITKAEHTKKLDKANAESEKFKAQYEEANKSLDTFKDLEERYEKEKNELNDKVEETENHYKSLIEARDRNDAINNAIEGITFSSMSAKKSIVSEIQSKNLPMQDGKLVGVKEVIDLLKEEDPSAFKEEAKGKFTAPKGKDGGKPLTKDDIVKIKNPAERKEQIAKHKELFTKE